MEAFFINDQTNHFGYKHLFHSIIGLTLGLAIFDLAKAILENEVIKNNNILKESVLKPKILTNFIGSIIIALLIESLLLVFKSALNGYQHFDSALLLIIVTSFLILILSIYNFLNEKAKWYKRKKN